METASSGEVFVAVASGLAVIAWALTYWNAHRKGKSVYREVGRPLHSVRSLCESSVSD